MTRVRVLFRVRVEFRGRVRVEFRGRVRVEFRVKANYFEIPSIRLSQVFCC